MYHHCIVSCCVGSCLYQDEASALFILMTYLHFCRPFPFGPNSEKNKNTVFIILHLYYAALHLLGAVNKSHALELSSNRTHKGHICSTLLVQWYAKPLNPIISDEFLRGIIFEHDVRDGVYNDCALGFNKVSSTRCTVPCHNL